MEPSDVHRIIASVFDPVMTGVHKTSMIQDMMAKKQTEIDSICGTVLAEVKKLYIGSAFRNSVQTN